MLTRLLDHYRWRHSRAFDEAVLLALGEIKRDYGDAALDKARYKAGRRQQSPRRKWVWKAVVRRLESDLHNGPDT